jgi:hypothetical protein
MRGTVTPLESIRLQQAYAKTGPVAWLRWGPYLSERQWGTVREDYSAGGDAWSYFPHDQARSRAYRWGEDGLAGLCDEDQKLCFALALWNGRDPILKERLFGLTNDEGNHGEDVKEYYYYQDNTPTHSYMKWLYKYPQAEFPYKWLVDENARRKQTDGSAPEFELVDTGVFNEGRYFDVQVEYAKAGPDDILIRITVTNRGPDAAGLDVLPTLWFRNTWSWFVGAAKPRIEGQPTDAHADATSLTATPAGDGKLDSLPPMKLYCQGTGRLLVVDNESNARRLWQSPSSPAFPKDGINDQLIHGANTTNPALTGTKACAVYSLQVPAGQAQVLQLRLSADTQLSDPFGADFLATLQARAAEADTFYDSITPAGLSPDRKNIMRQAYAGMLWSKQYYHYIVRDWLEGDATQPPPPQRWRNRAWTHFYADQVLSMPDVWEYPWFAAWDLCFHAVVFARLDCAFAKEQLLTISREWYMSPDGAVPAYEWAFDDVNPPLQAWAALRILRTEAETTGTEDLDFAQSIFNYSLMYFTWWANRKDPEGDDMFGGGFLGLDNIAVINRSNIEALEGYLGRGLRLCQSDGTSWMGLFCLSMLELALKLAPRSAEYTRLGNKFLQHFVEIGSKIDGFEHPLDGQIKLWDEDDGFYYDVLRIDRDGGGNEYIPIKLRSLVGLIPLLPVLAIDMSSLEPGTSRELLARIDWFGRIHPQMLARVWDHSADSHLLSFVDPDRLRRILARVFDESEFLAPYGIRSISRAYRDTPFTVNVHGHELSERYEPAESSHGDFGGNSNWRGPIWFPINFLLVEALRRYHAYLGDGFTVEFPTGSGRQLTLSAIADELARRLVSVFEGTTGRRPVFGGVDLFQHDPEWNRHILFYEYFHGDNGAGIGASHQTGWTGLVAELMRQPA